eukprot:5156770-Amphidinium_carterae.1
MDMLGEFLGVKGSDIEHEKPYVVAFLSDQEFDDMVFKWRVKGADDAKVEPSPIMMARVRLLRAACDTIAKNLKVNTPAPPVEVSPVTAATPSKKIKMSMVLDPTDEGEFTVGAPAQITKWFSNYEQLKGGAPMEEHEPTPEQISALNERVVVFGLEPYADFSILTPFGRRIAKLLRHRSWVQQEDGTFKPLDVPGPGDFTTWAACWKVYATTLLMLRFDDGQGGEVPVARPQALEVYFEAFRKLAAEVPEAWHLCARAEDRACAELMPRLRRAVKERPPTSWDSLFERVAMEDRYWDREVRRPALNFLARGRTSTMANIAETNQVAEKVNTLVRARMTPDGVEICYAFHAGKCTTAVCPKGRAHQCQICFGKHRNQDCPQAKGGHADASKPVQ